METVVTSDALPPSAKPTLLGLLKSHGWTTVSFQALEQGVDVHGDLSAGAVAYADTGSAWVAAGGPIAPVDLVPSLAREFLSAAAARGRRVCFCAAEERLDCPGLSRLQIGAQPIWDARRWPEILAGSRSLREQLRRARAKGVRIRRVEAHELDAGHPVRLRLEALVHQWLASRKGPRLRFLLDVQLFEFPRERMIFVAEQGETVVGALSAVPVFARRGWFFEDVLRSPDAPNGTAELLVDAGMTAAAQSGQARVTMGLVPLSGDVPKWLRIARWFGHPFYDFGGLERFREKLRPQSWEPVYLVYPEGEFALVALWDTLSAVMGMSPVRWAIQALRHRRPAFRAG